MQAETLSQYLLALQQNLHASDRPDWFSVARLLQNQSQSAAVALQFGSSTEVLFGQKTPTPWRQTLALHKERLELCFYLYQAEHEENLKSYWHYIAPTLHTLLQLSQQKPVEQQRLEPNQALCWALVKLNRQGHMLAHNPLAAELFELGLLLHQQHQPIQVNGLPHWITRQLDRLEQQGQSWQSMQLHFRGQDYQCNLYYHHMQLDFWQPQAPQIYLLIRPIWHKPDPSLLMQGLDISRAQAEIVALSSQGLSAAEIAKATQYQKHTIYSYLKQLYKQHQIHSQAQLAAKVWPLLPF